MIDFVEYIGPWLSMILFVTLLESMFVGTWELCHTVARKKRERRRANWLCPACKYPVQFTGGRCPECGPDVSRHWYLINSENQS